MISMLSSSYPSSPLPTPSTGQYLDLEDRIRWAEEMTRRGVVRDFEVRLRRADGELIWARDTTLARTDATGQVIHYEGVIEDITDKRSLQAQLHHSSKMEAVGRL